MQQEYEGMWRRVRHQAIKTKWLEKWMKEAEDKVKQMEAARVAAKDVGGAYFLDKGH